MKYFLIFRAIGLGHFIYPKCLGVSSLCNLYVQQFSFRHMKPLYAVIVRILKMCTLYFVHI